MTFPRQETTSVWRRSQEVPLAVALKQEVASGPGSRGKERGPRESHSSQSPVGIRHQGAERRPRRRRRTKRSGPPPARRPGGRRGLLVPAWHPSSAGMIP